MDNSKTARAAAIALCVDALDFARGRAAEDCDGTSIELIYDAATAAEAFPDVLKRFAAAVSSETEFRAPMTDRALGY